MSVISKQLAEQIAEKLTSKSKLAVDELKKQYEETVTLIYEAQTPKAVIECHSKHPEWFYTKRGIKFSGHGFRYEYVSSTRTIICNNGTDANLELDGKISAEIVAAKNKYEKAQDAHKALKRETESALLALKTHKNIREHLPDASPLLPPPISNALVVNFDSLKKRLERQPEIKQTATS